MLGRTLVGTLAIVCALLAGCGDDDGPPGETDAGAPMDAMVGGDGGEEVDCMGMPNGTSCGPMGFICVANTCVPTSCGDGFVDPGAMEQCEDGNVISRDGCEPDTCRYTCNEAAECDDMNACTGAEFCTTSTTHVCMSPSPPPPGTACTLAMGGMGECRASMCVAAGCGNMVTAGMEECDDGNMDDTDGCRADCTFTCENDDECADGNPCNGTETCTVATHLCNPASTPLDCSDMQNCTVDGCDPMAADPMMPCTHTLTDVDMDGFAATALGACTFGGMTAGGDCDDLNNARYPGAAEVNMTCDSVDSDCDGSTTDGTASITCYRDSDRDGYGLMTSTMSICGACPSGYVSRGAPFDCYDGTSSRSLGASVYPSQTMYFTSSYCPGICLPGGGSYDYNCDGTATKQYTSAGSSGCSYTPLFGGFCLGSGWVGATAPACGASASYRTCSRFGTFTTCISTTASRTQACR